MKLSTVVYISDCQLPIANLKKLTGYSVGAPAYEMNLEVRSSNRQLAIGNRQ